MNTGTKALAGDLRSLVADWRLIAEITEWTREGGGDGKRILLEAADSLETVIKRHKLCPKPKRKDPIPA